MCFFPFFLSGFGVCPPNLAFTEIFTGGSFAACGQRQGLLALDLDRFF
jgi:hypothetical protein